MEACNLFRSIRVGSRTCCASQGGSGGASIRVDPHAAKSKMIVGVLDLSSKRLALLRWLKSQLVGYIDTSKRRWLSLLEAVPRDDLDVSWNESTCRNVEMSPCILRHIPWIEMSFRLRFFS
jgi:hypothetical protein